MELMDTLTRCFPFVNSLSDDGKEELARNFSTSFSGRDEILLMQGDCVSGAYLVVSGELQVFTLSEDGKETILYTIGHGESCFFALNSLFREMVYPAWVKVASKEAKIVVIKGGFIKHAFDTEKALRDWVLSVQSSRVIDLMCSVDELMNLSLLDRLKNYLIRMVDQSNEVKTTHELIARNLGSTREVVTRKLHELADDRAITLERGCIRVIDRQKLTKRTW